MSAAVFTLRCPHCLAKVDVAPGMGGGTLAQNQLPDPTFSAVCPDCGQAFRLAEALPVDASEIDIAASLNAGKPSLGPAGLLAAVAVGVATVVVSALLAEQMNGPVFLVLYAVVGVLLLGATWIVRLQYREQGPAMLIGFLSFEAIGVLRYFMGSAHGMHKWTYMGVMMLVGGLLFFVSASVRSGYGGSGSCSGFNSWFASSCSGGASCGSGGSCGGGGCGGGGCGGCGGS
jgi:hypothetical protein